MKVLLIQPPHEYGAETRIPNEFPLGLGYIAKVLLQEGHSVKVLDIYGNQFKQEQVVDAISKQDFKNFDIIGISALSTQYNYVKWLSHEIKRRHPKKKIVVGGPLPLFSSEIVFKHTSIDICALGEGETIFKNLLDNFDNLRKVNGINFKEGGKIMKTPAQPYIKDLDAIPFPAWNLFPITVYLNTPKYPEAYGLKTMNLITSRGCPFNCNFCSKTFSGVRMRSIDNIIEEIKELKRLYNIRALHFTEELVMMNKQRMMELCDALKPMKLKWVCQGRTNFVDYEMLKKMEEAGCVRVGYGIESGSQKILNNMNKAQTVEMCDKAIRLTKKAGLIPVIQMMFGYPGETRETIKETIDFCDRVHAQPNAGEFFITTPLPGTQLYDYALQKGLIGDEEKYLERLTGCGELLVNFTDFSDEEFMKLKKETENAIARNYSRYRNKHLDVLIKEYAFKVFRFVRYCRYNGIAKSFKEVLLLLKNNPNQLFEAEYK